LIIPDTINQVVFGNGTLSAIGTSWTAGTDFMVTNNSDYSVFENYVLWCNDLCEGFKENGGRTRHDNPQIYRMTLLGFHKPNGTGGDLRVLGGQIGQFRSTDTAFADQNNFTATGIKIDQSDCKIHNTLIRWCGTCYEAVGGQQELYDCHFVQGTAAAYLRTNAKHIQWDIADAGGKISFHGCYFDNGYSDFDDDQVHFVGCKALIDDTDVDIDSMFRFYYNGEAECRATSTPFSFAEWDDTVDLFAWLPDRTTPFDDWPDDHSTLVDYSDSTLASAHRRNIIELANQKHLLSTNSNGPATTTVSNGTTTTAAFVDANTTGSPAKFGSKGDNAFIDAQGILEAEVKAVQLVVQDSEPTAAGNGSFALSDGTISTNGFGIYGAGVYNKTAGVWRKDRPGEFTVATLPAVSGSTGHIIYVSDESGGATLAFSNGVNWLRVQDRAIVS